MGSVGETIRKLLSTNKKALLPDTNWTDYVVKMSDINHSLNESCNNDDIKSIKNLINTSYLEELDVSLKNKINESRSQNEEASPKSVATDKLNELDFQKFLEDLQPIPEKAEANESSDFRLKETHDGGKLCYVFENKSGSNPGDVKVIKIKITVPKGVLSSKTSKPNDPELKQSLNKTFPPILKAPSRQNQQASKPNVRTRPIMGRAALLNRLEDSGKPSTDSKESEIIRELVTQRFHNCILHYQERSLKRLQTRKDRSLNFDVDLESTDEFLERQAFEDEALMHSSPQQNTARQVESSSRTYESLGSFYPSSNVESSREMIRSYSSGLSKSSSLSKYGFASTDFEQYLSTATPVDSPVENRLTENEKSAEYDQLKFLQEALGEELNRYASIESQLHRDKLQKQSPPKIRTEPLNSSVGSSDISALLSTRDASSFATCTLLPQKPERTSLPVRYEAIDEMEPENDPNQAENPYLQYFPNSQRLNNLIRDAQFQFHAMQQTSKALKLCETLKEFMASTELVEAERILLIATKKREAITGEIRKIEHYEELAEYELANLGEVTIGNLTFPGKPTRRNLNQADVIRHSNKRKNQFTRWYVCTISCGPQLVATRAVQADQDGFIKFEDVFVFSNLQADFEVDVCIYTMLVKNSLRNYSHESKFHLNKDEKHLCLTSPTRYLQMSRSLSKLKLAFKEDSFRPTSFKLCGRHTLRVNELNEMGHFRLAEIPASSDLTGTVIMDLASKVILHNRQSSFLNVGKELGQNITWRRLWVSIDDSKLRCYNSPEDQYDSEPINVIDLAYCISSLITIVDRKICAKPRTLLIETLDVQREGNTGTSQKSQILRHFLSAETSDSMRNWQNNLNSIVSALRNWNSMKCRLHVLK